MINDKTSRKEWFFWFNEEIKLYFLSWKFSARCLCGVGEALTDWLTPLLTFRARSFCRVGKRSLIGCSHSSHSARVAFAEWGKRSLIGWPPLLTFSARSFCRVGESVHWLVIPTPHMQRAFSTRLKTHKELIEGSKRIFSLLLK